MDQRLEQLKTWLKMCLHEPVAHIRPASADASFRRYFRITTDTSTYIAMDAPPDKENTGPFIEVGRRFHALGLNVPEILQVDHDNGFLLLGDLGDTVYLDRLNPDSVERLYGDAMGALVVLQAGIYTDSNFLPPYDETLFMAEMALFRDWYLGRHLQRSLSADDNRVIDDAFALLAQSALAQAPVWVHRDYHSRNLMVTQAHNPGILDFQDAVLGPATYDLVSLLRDCYIAWPEVQVMSWVEGYHALALESGIPVTPDVETFIKQFDLMGVQRHLKAAGIFARLNHRDGKPGYLEDIPRTLGYIYDVARRYPALAAFVALLESHAPDVRTS